MTRIFTEGFELADQGCFESVTGQAFSKTSPRTGGNYYMTAQTAWKTIPNLSEFYYRHAIKGSMSGSSWPLVAWRNSTTWLGQICWDSSTGYPMLYVGGSLVATWNTLVMNNATWYVLEVHVKIADAGGIVDLKIDGVPIGTFSGDTKPAAQTYVDSIGAQGSSGANVRYMDDCALNDTNGTVDNSWCGDGHVIALVPNAAGDVTQLTPSSAVANYTCVDEIPVATSPDDYVEGSTIGNYDLYNLTTANFAGQTIKRVWVEGRVYDTVAAGGLCNLGIKIDGAENWSSDISMLTTQSFAKGPEYVVKPNTSPWAANDIDNLQAGFKVK